MATELCVKNSKRPLIAAFCVLLACLFAPSNSHPNCVEPVNGNIFPPQPNPPLAYCAEYGLDNDGACCTATTEIDKAKKPAESMINFASGDPDVAACAAQVKHIYCTWCNPYAGHNYEAENGQGHRAAPWLCQAYCQRFYQACANIPLNTTGPGTVGSPVHIPGLTPTMGVTTLAAHFQSANDFCAIYATGNPGSCYTDNPQELVTLPGGASVPIATERAYPNLVFNAATIPLNNPAWYMHITHILIAPGTTRQFATFQHGVVLSWNDDPAANAFNVVLDVQAQTFFDNGGGSEYGAMGIGFHPNFIQNGWMYLKHSHLADRDRIIRYTVDRTTWVADPASALVILDYQMFGVMHHGAPPIFASDGKMYIANGDGTNYFDNGKDYNPAKDPMSLLGKVLRIDVDNSAAGNPYAVPADNPFVGQAGWAPEIWAYGFRNPWRFTYDAPTNRFWTGVVGQTLYEGIWIAERGKFHGWHTREAYNCYWPTMSTPTAPFTACATAGEVLPLFEFPHDQGACATASNPAHCQFPAISGNAVIGGYVYRGTKNPSLYGTYIWGNYQPDFEAWVYTLGYDSANPFNVKFVWRLGFTFEDGHDPNNWSISTLGLDSEGEMLVVNINDPNEILRFLPDGTGNPPNAATPTPPTPSTANPSSGTPSNNAPGTSAPGTSAPGTSAPGTSAPGTSAPGTVTPVTNSPQILIQPVGTSDGTSKFNLTSSLVMIIVSSVFIQLAAWC